MTTDLDLTDNPRLIRQQAALCRFAAAVERLTQQPLDDSAALERIREEVRRLNEVMDWQVRRDE